jgi:WD40 repeat protein
VRSKEADNTKAA